MRLRSSHKIRFYSQPLIFYSFIDNFSKDFSSVSCFKLSGTLKMTDDAQKTLKSTLVEVLSVIFDVISCFVLAIPIFLYEAFRLIYKSRKDIRGKLALVKRSFVVIDEIENLCF